MKDNRTRLPFNTYKHRIRRERERERKREYRGKEQQRSSQSPFLFPSFPFFSFFLLKLFLLSLHFPFSPPILSFFLSLFSFFFSFLSLKVELEREKVVGRRRERGRDLFCSFNGVVLGVERRFFGRFAFLFFVGEGEIRLSSTALLSSRRERVRL